MLRSRIKKQINSHHVKAGSRHVTGAEWRDGTSVHGEERDKSKNKNKNKKKHVLDFPKTRTAIYSCKERSNVRETRTHFPLVECVRNLKTFPTRITASGYYTFQQHDNSEDQNPNNVYTAQSLLRQNRNTHKIIDGNVKHNAFLWFCI